MGDKPVLFSGPMVRALLDGRKTQTRRVITDEGALLTLEAFDPDFVALPGNRAYLPIRVAAGDRLWVREAWKTDRYHDAIAPREMSGEEPLIYVADNEVQRWGWKPELLSRWGRFRQGMHMPRWASRLTLTVTDVRVERVQGITRDDCVAEGIEKRPEVAGGTDRWRDYSDTRSGVSSPIISFRTLWDGLNEPRGFGWDVNPWIAAYSFTLERRNIDT